ncbi:hypothetical protein K502DRAFT_232896 [Neoconidiobolus thromboides FSU 785]|nr:hypothetical protein K502DRAFT_232896 [Neoconidiobolus thromboides FSU 785]
MEETNKKRASYIEGDIDYEEDDIEKNEKDKKINRDPFNRNYVLVLGIRGTINFLIAAIKYLLWKKKEDINIKSLYLNPAIIRNGKVIGGYTFLWKFFNFIFKKWDLFKENRYFLSGMLAGSSILFEVEESRVDYSLMLFFRILQTQVEKRKQLDLYSNVLYVFSDTLIHLSHALYPQFLDPSIFNIFNRFGSIPPESIYANQRLYNNQNISSSLLIQQIKDQGFNTNYINNIVTKNQPLNCTFYHPNDINCKWAVINKLKKVIKFTLPVYLSVNLLPKMVFQPAQILNNPKNTLLKTIQKSIRSTGFISIYIAIYQFLVCKIQNQSLNIINYPISLLSGILITIFSTINLESNQRKLDLANYMAPKAVKSLIKLLHFYRLIPTIKYVESLLFVISSGYLMWDYKNNSVYLKPIVKKVLKSTVDYSI